MPSAPRFLLPRLAALVVLSALGCAQERTPEAKPARSPRRLESVTWNSVKRELTWVISKGERDQKTGAYKPLTSETYLINMDKATMTFNGETRGFSKQEAVNVSALLDIIAKYAIESTLWWDQGHGRRVDDKDQPGAGVTRVALDPDLSPAFAQLLFRLQQLRPGDAEVGSRVRTEPSFTLRPALLID
jgi:hypothetical protein